MKKARLALAVAVIKNKPSGQSGREHAEALAGQLRSLDEGWRNKAQRLQREVLRLRQELLLAKMTPNTQSAREAAGDDNTMDLSQNLIGPVKELCSLDLDSGCDTETLLPTPDAAEPRTNRKPDPPPATSGPPPPLPSMLLHMQFLQSLCGLRRLEGKDCGQAAAWLGPDGDTESVLVDSVRQLLDSVVAACREAPPLPPAALLLQACQVAARAVDLCCSQKQPSPRFVTHVEESLRELTGMLLHADQLNRLQVEEKLMGCLIVLGRSGSSKSFLIRHVLSQINGLAERLWQACQGKESSGPEEFAVNQYENSVYLFWILEELLQKSEVPGREEMGSGVTSHHHTAEQKALLGQLEHHVLLLSDEFPLFALYMWRLGGLLSCSDTAQDPPCSRNMHP
ncbi:meiosis-specific protein MEI4 [Centroberyx gerrardi]